ncbi:MAG: glycine zipper family protein [Polaromonas sp.]|uniref:glycine zipper family protein n=1 Tax=Polaromonas sp. TaxID=1869339 RepID=UPI0017966461|nr:glycine zipper family protein [Polaromonas sp.]NMM10025.1 glycine zipper family protein [Polaromonas sp.]
MKSSSRILGMAAASIALILLSACAASGPNSASARPVLYPNATLNRVGEAQGQLEANACMSRAVAAGLAPTQNNNEIGRRAGEGAATAGVASAVGALITGRGGEGVLRAGTAGAAIGGSAGAVSGAFHNDRPNGTYRNFVHRCLSEKGFEVIGWN